MLDNNKKVDVLMRYERRRKIRQILALVGVLVTLGALMIYFQIMNYEDIN